MVNKVIEQAKAWIGRKESDGSHKEIINIYNNHRPLARGYKVKYTDPWCATFVSAVAIKCGCTDVIPTECGCEQMIDLFKKSGNWIENENRTPNIGDIIFYDWNDNGVGDNKGYSDHVGIVEKVSNGKITVIEGNYSDGVGRRVIAVNGKGIRGYGVPKYSVNSGNSTVKVGDTVTVINAVTYDGKPFKLWHSKYKVMSLSGDRVVIGVNGVVTAAVNKANLKRV